LEPDQTTPARQGNDWATGLIAACIGVGFLMSWGTYEMRQRVAQWTAEQQFRHERDAMAAMQMDLGQLLADPGTKLIRLTPAIDQTPPLLVSVAWNDSRQTGAIFWRNQPEQVRQRYLVRLISSGGAATAATIGPTEPGRTVYLFSPPPGNIATPREIVLCDYVEGDATQGAGGPPLASGKIIDAD
jgi:hypothetical protein